MILLKKDQRTITDQNISTDNSNTSINAFTERKNKNLSL